MFTGPLRTWVVTVAALALLIPLSACTQDNPYETRPVPSSASASASATSSSPGDPLTVETSSGRLEGLADGPVRKFLGVRYAQPPTGERRWTLPVMAERAEGTVDAQQSGARCTQGETGAEDCLFLEVTTPAKAEPGQKLPVMVWWHGGGYTSGAGSDYDAARLAERGNVMVVTINYRLGVFGYLSLPGLEGSGTFGLADQILATRWTKQNATAFGGDPANITVFGESAGAMSACAFLTSPEAEGLVDKVAMSSGGSCQLSWPENGLVVTAAAQTPYVSLKDGEKLGAAQAKKVGCQKIACLRRSSAEDLLKISPQFHDVLAYDTPLLPADPAQAVTEGKTPPIPVLSSVNRHEARAFVGATVQEFTELTYPSYVAAAYPGKETEVLGEYPLEKYGSAALAWSALITDSSWACPTQSGNTALATNGSPVFAGEFADPDAPDINRIASKGFDPAAAHGNDLPYLFDLAGKNALADDQQQDLADTMIEYWSSFARTGVPTAAGQPDWPQFNGPNAETLRLQPDDVDLIDFATEHNCAFWSDL
ncbi:carboxylesterase/lipase family protein [Kineosporia babensis]|uniref:Carboxylic ester hydrolase n=1 Tax=Kineosporia babensis TaxID=499548 RepID=A0A9X1NM67_9ACTN|nr:carboxylesterase family protein [Kineosporia babensis]MCD5316920.1 carboxylesterase family protein [Kineosporia babensis]